MTTSPLHMPAYGPWYCVTKIRGRRVLVLIIEGGSEYWFYKALRKDGPFDSAETAAACGATQCLELGLMPPAAWEVASTRRMYPAGEFPDAYLHERQEWCLKKFPIRYGQQLEHIPWNPDAALPLWARYGIHGPRQEAMVL